MTEDNDNLTLQRWLREERRKDHDHQYPDYLWMKYWTKQAPLREVLEIEHSRR
jgi:hypothetical protein